MESSTGNTANKENLLKKFKNPYIKNEILNFLRSEDIRKFAHDRVKTDFQNKLGKKPECPVWTKSLFGDKYKDLTPENLQKLLGEDKQSFNSIKEIFSYLFGKPDEIQKIKVLFRFLKK